MKPLKKYRFFHAFGEKRLLGVPERCPGRISRTATDRSPQKPAITGRRHPGTGGLPGATVKNPTHGQVFVDRLRLTH